MLQKRFFTLPFERSALPNGWDFLAFMIVFGVIVSIVKVSTGMNAPLASVTDAPISLDYSALPYYALRTTMRMFIALICSLLFTLVYATIAAKSRRAEMAMIPLLDILQSVPVLGYLSFITPFFLGLFPGSSLGAECAAVFAIFTSQAWNMTFSFYQSLRNTPTDLEEVSRGFGLSSWQKFWHLETPYALPGLIWNTMLSMSGGWFFVVASEAMTVGDVNIKLPGVGSYLATAIEQKDSAAVLATIVTMALVILAYDQLIFRPLVAFSEKFRLELTVSQTKAHSFVRDMFSRSRWMRRLTSPVSQFFRQLALMRLAPAAAPKFRLPSAPIVSRGFDILWFILLGAGVIWAGWQIYVFVSETLSWSDFVEAFKLGLVTLLRVTVLIALASVFWTPVAIWMGLRPAWREKAQPLAQFLAAFPANVLYPIAVVTILKYNLNPDIWLSFLMIFGTQWYIVFNVLGGASVFPNDLQEAAKNFQVTGWDWWRKIMLPGVFTYYVTGAITASGGSWNAAQVSEYVKWGDDTVVAHGIGAYLQQATIADNKARIILSIAIMSVFVIAVNRLFWRPLYVYAERKLRMT